MRREEGGALLMISRKLKFNDYDYGSTTH